MDHEVEKQVLWNDRLDYLPGRKEGVESSNPPPAVLNPDKE